MSLPEILQKNIRSVKARKAFTLKETSINADECVVLANDDAPFIDMLTLAMFLGIDCPTLSVLGAQTNKCYKKFFIDKATKQVVPKNFLGNLREINSPIPELKEIQKKLIEVFAAFPIHEANAGFTHGKSIKDAVSAVKDGETLIHVDLEKFFDSHSFLYVKEKLYQKFKEAYSVELGNDVLNALVSLLCLNNRLPQGAPSSPCLVVALNYEMDANIESLARKYELSYSRYADDLSFSGVITNETVFKFIRELINIIQPFRINFNKLGIMRHSAKPIFKNFDLVVSDTLKEKELELVKSVVKNIFPNLVFNVTRKSKSKVMIFVDRLKDFSKDEIINSSGVLEEELLRKLKCEDNHRSLVLKPKFFYIQSTKHVLGLNIQDGRFNFPRKEYEDLRVLAMLVGRQDILGTWITQIEDFFNSKNKDESMIYKAFPNLGLNLNIIKRILEASILFTKDPGNRNSYRDLINNPINIASFEGILSHLQNVDNAKYLKLKAIREKSANKCLKQLEGYLRTIFEQDNSLVAYLNIFLDVIFRNTLKDVVSVFKINNNSNN